MPYPQTKNYRTLKTKTRSSSMSDDDKKSPYSKYRRKAKEAFSQAKFQKALGYYEKALKKHNPGSDPSDLEQVHTSRAVCLIGLDQFDEAIKEADLAIKCNIYFSKAYYRKAEALGRLKRFSEAQTMYHQCLTYEAEEDARDLIVIRKLVLKLDEQDDENGIFFKFLTPGVDYCERSTFNPVTKVIQEIACQMRNLIYLIGDVKSRECMVVDPCWDVDGILRVAQKNRMTIKGIIHTHNHFDHVGGKPPPPFDSYHISVPGAKKLLEKLDNSAKVYIHQLDADVYQSESGIDPERIKPTVNQEELQIGRLAVKFIHTPGHTPGSQCIQVGEGRILTGDTLFVGSCGRCDLPGGSVTDLYNSLQVKLASLPDTTVLFPAHLYSNMVMTSVDREKRHGLLKQVTLQEWLEFFGQEPINRSEGI